MKLDGTYWDDVTRPHRRGGGPATWRHFCDGLHRALLGEWLPGAEVHRALKTDLFDESTHGGLVPTMTATADVVHAVDLAAQIPSEAAARHPGLCGLRADVRALPYPGGAFDLIVSNSTLDHFPRRSDLVAALVELRRVTAEGGLLVITLDNAENPVVRLRSVVPQGLLRRLRLVPYFVGATLSEEELVSELERLGYTVRHRRTLMHAPRIPAMVACRIIDSWGSSRTGAALLRVLRAAERLERLPTRRWTGYYVAVSAVRPDGSGS